MSKIFKNKKCAVLSLIFGLFVFHGKLARATTVCMDAMADTFQDLGIRFKESSENRFLIYDPKNPNSFALRMDLEYDSFSHEKDPQNLSHISLHASRNRITNTGKETEKVERQSFRIYGYESSHVSNSSEHMLQRIVAKPEKIVIISSNEKNYRDYSQLSEELQQLERTKKMQEEDFREAQRTYRQSGAEHRLSKQNLRSGIQESIDGSKVAKLKSEIKKLDLQIDELKRKHQTLGRLVSERAIEFGYLKDGQCYVKAIVDHALSGEKKTQFTPSMCLPVQKIEAVVCEKYYPKAISSQINPESSSSGATETVRRGQSQKRSGVDQ